MNPMTDDGSYKKLGISRDASLSEIKKAYHKKAFELHPDKSKNSISEAEREFKELNKAYHTILDNKKVKTELEDTKVSDKKNSESLFIENEYGDHLFNIFDFFDLFFFKNYSRKGRIFSHNNQGDIRIRTNINVNSCSGKHDKYTICLKCGRD